MEIKIPIMAEEYFKLAKTYRIQYNTNPFEKMRTGEIFKYEPAFVMQKK